MRKDEPTPAAQPVIIAGRAQRPNESFRNAVLCAVAGVAFWALYSWFAANPAAQ